MYQIYCDGYLLHGIDGYLLPSAKLSLEVNKAGSLDFDILPDHPNITTLEKLKPEILVTKNGVKYWKGRIKDDTQNLDTTRSIFCEGKLGCLADSIIRPQTISGTATQVFTALLGIHNTQVSDFQQLKVGNVTVTGSPYRAYEDYGNTYDRLQDLVTSYGGYLFVRYETDGDYLDWLVDFTTISAQSIELGENILDLSQEISAQTTYTACIPLGAKLLDENGSETENRLTVKSLLGTDVVFSQEKVSEYGWIYAPPSETTWDDITTAGGLNSKASDYLANTGIKLALTLNIKALDLAYTDTDIDSFNFCEYIQVTSAVHGISEQYLLSKMEIDIADPTNTNITLGETVLTLTDKNRRQNQNVTFTINDLQNALAGTNQNITADIVEREMYIRYVGGVIELGQTDSDLLVRLSNTELAFYESINGVETKVAYISNPTGNPGDSKLYVENGRILQSMQFGNFSFEPRDNGNMSISYKGV